MPVRTRRFVDHATGTITDNPLTDSATTINSAGFASLPVVGTGGAIYLTLDPGGANERVPVTAHSSSATSVTVERPNGVQHTAGTRWVASVYAEDIPESPDRLVRTSKLLLSIDFEGEESTDPADAGGAWLNQGGSTFVRRMGRGILTQPTSSGTVTIRGVEFTLPSLPSFFEITAKIWVAKIAPVNFYSQGLGLRESSTNECYLAGFHFNSGVNTLGHIVSGRSYSNLTTEGAIATSATINHGFHGYFTIRKNSSDDWDAEFSVGGGARIAYHTGLALDTFFAPDRVFFGGDNRAANNIITECDWIRMWDLT